MRAAKAPRKEKLTKVSIPKGAIMSCRNKQTKNMLCLVSIPKGAIMSTC